MIGGKRFTVPHSVWGNLSSRDSRSAAAFDAVNNVYAASQQQDYEDKERERNLGIAQRDAQFSEDRRRFDERINLLRGLFGGMGGDGGYAPMPAAQHQPSAAQAGFGMVSGGASAPSFNDGMDRKKIQNMLQLYLSQRLGG